MLSKVLRELEVLPLLPLFFGFAAGGKRGKGGEEEDDEEEDTLFCESDGFNARRPSTPMLTTGTAAAVGVDETTLFNWAGDDALESAGSSEMAFRNAWLGISMALELISTLVEGEVLFVFNHSSMAARS